MRYVVLLVTATVVAFVFMRARAMRTPAAMPMHRIRTDDLPAVLRQLESSGAEGSFAGFIFNDPKRPGSEPLNIQFSIEDGRVGFDWLLLQELNVEDQHRFIQLVSRRGQLHRTISMNGVSYLRVESGDLAGLATAVAQELYDLSREEPFEMITEGFEWSTAHTR